MKANNFNRGLRFLLGYNLYTLVEAAVLANNVRLNKLAAVGAIDHAGNCKLPVGASLTLSCLGCSSLGNCHF